MTSGENMKAEKKTDEEILKNVKEHILSFERVESHYCRRNSTKQYLDGSLNISEMYRLYTDYCREKELPLAKKHIYSTVFHSLNLSFHQPKKDQCCICTGYKNSTDTEKLQLQDNYNTHIKEKEMSRAEKTKDIEAAKQDTNKIACCFDLQAVLPSPCGECSSLYYKRKLSCYNFTIYDISNSKGHCYFWHEGLAKRGSNEIGTCLYKFITSLPNTVNEVVLFSDNCAGQNKNKFIASLLLYCVNNIDHINTITHKFLIQGHTQNENDSMHSTIEREKRRVVKGGTITLPAQWVPVLKLAKKKGSVYNVTELDTADIFNLKDLSQQMGNNFSKNENNNLVNWPNIKIIKVMKQDPYTIFYKHSYAQEDFEKLNIRQRMRGRSAKVMLHPAYSSPPGIDAGKKKDLLDLCKSGVIPSVHASFYNSLKVSSSVEKD
ncbi:uncharacterized protein LOC111614620 [Centruroides sculpturatus]|uniref:uncharacterized protein LOC111614620 n=1 Tax=Centruroides sculpturatus TaxID=218467 RepID=UPI000C6CCDBD|nr:uncharacterized protein LOC111614620 [Centruroides sculpturatus]